MKEVRRRNRRLYIPDGIYFITSITQNRNPLFQDAHVVNILRETLRKVKSLYTFYMQAYVFMPDHFHLLIHPKPEVSISTIMHSFKRNVTWNYKKVMNISPSTSISLWQYGCWDHVIRDEKDYERHFDYIHYNPVKHGYVTKPEDFLHSSYNIYVKKGWYKIGWGHKEIKELRDLSFE